MIVLTSFCLAITTLFKGLLSEVEFNDGHLIYVTEIGGLADVDLNLLVEEESVITKQALFLVDTNGNKANIYLSLYSATDVERMITYLLNYLDD